MGNPGKKLVLVDDNGQVILLDEYDEDTGRAHLMSDPCYVTFNRDTMILDIHKVAIHIAEIRYLGESWPFDHTSYEAILEYFTEGE